MGCLPCPLVKQLLDRRPWDWQIVLVLVEPGGEVALDVVRPASVDLSGRVLRFAESLFAEAVAQIMELGGTPSVDFKFLRSSAPERSAAFSMPRVIMEPFDVTTGTGSTPLTEELSLIALQPDAGAAITAVVLNETETL